MADIASMMTVFNTFKKVVSKIEDGSYEDLVKDEAAKKLLLTQGSMTRLLAPFIIEPTIVISKSLREEEVTEKIINLNIDMFAAFYAQAFNVLVNVYNLEGSAAFELLSSRRGLESLVPDNFNMLNASGLISNEELEILPIKASTIKMVASMEKNSSSDMSGVSKASVSDSKTDIPTIIHKNIDMSFKITDKYNKTVTVEVPLTIKANVIYTNFRSISNMLETNSDDNSFSSRFDEYRSGGISLSDLIFAGDMIKRYKDNKLKDEDDLLKLLGNRSRSANYKLISDSAVGFGKYHAMLIISDSEKVSIEHQLRGKIDKPKFKEKLMEQTKSLFVTVADLSYERATIYTKDIKGTSDVSFRALSKKRGDSSGDMTEIFKALISNKPPLL